MATIAIERYMALPGQALGYKIGGFKIAELRNRASATMGPKFSLPRFHAVVLGSGTVPRRYWNKRSTIGLPHRSSTVNGAIDADCGTIQQIGSTSIRSWDDAYDQGKDIRDATSSLMRKSSATMPRRYCMASLGRRALTIVARTPLPATI